MIRLNRGAVVEQEKNLNPEANRFPRQALFILGNEAAERYSYYGMKGILALYITNVLLMSKDKATQIIHIFSFVNYFMPVLGAYVSDRWWGRYKTILWISLFYCLGHATLALSDAFDSIDAKTLCLYAGLALIAFGSGGIKPCVSAFMGDQFKPEQRHLLPRAYAAFYWSINLGSTAAFLTIPYVRKEWSYSWAFGIPGIAMAVATFVFWLGTRYYVMVPPARETKAAGFFRVFFHAWRHRHERRPGESFWAPALNRFKPEEVDAAASVGPILKVFALAPVFWALFDQTFSTWVLQGEQMRPAYIGSAELTPASITDPQRLLDHLRNPTNQVGQWIWQRLPQEERESLEQTDARSTRDVRDQLADALNPLILGGSLYNPDIFDTNRLSAEVLLALRYADDPQRVPRLNRLLLEESFPDAIAKAYRIGPEEMLSANPILVMILVPVMSLGIYPLLGRLATPLRRMSCGMFLAAVSFLIVAWIQQRIDDGQVLSIWWQLLPYTVLTIGEVLFSTTGLEFAFREAAPSMKSIIMGFWTLTVAVGNLFVMVVTALAGAVLGHGGSNHEVAVTPQMFLFYAGLTFVVAIAFSVVATFYKYRDPQAALGR
ncbi:POT family MFS transporter [Limisphaera ngatamarikiensis]|uniref:POT family MFS transporter n=1 Tax=Limisphaera ngatamarikiensis TaxID=1324935 RepID=A0A6M1RVH5_9BACT|nr:MFS transporter [Limisphaera ngatamarikiensis]NGO38782.1 POT family MFS transporter [Limisphaera ngatamarikiensis]